MKISLLAAAAAVALWGCASNDGAERTAEDESMLEEASYVDQARESREESDMTVYDESATGGSGQAESVTTEDGTTWDTLEEPHGDEITMPDPQYDPDDEETGESPL